MSNIWLEKINNNDVADIFMALSDNYLSMYYVDFDENKIKPYRLSKSIDEKYGEYFRSCPSYEDAISLYIRNTVAEEDRESMIKECSISNLIKQLDENGIYSHDYRGVWGDNTYYFRMKVAKLPSDPGMHKAVIGFADVDIEKHREIEQFAYQDAVTGGDNYIRFKEKLEKCGKSGFIVSMDIHSFKIVNTFCGVLKGDMAIKNMWLSICENLEADDFAGHINGDHFVIYLSEKPVEAVEKQLLAMRQSIVEIADKINIPAVLPFFGVTSWEDEKTIELAYTEANEAKRQIKERKDINHNFYTKRDTQRIWEETEMEKNFEIAIKEESFEVWYQPKYNPVQKRLMGAEALIRWRKPDGTLVPPGKFIPLFERNGMIRLLDEYVFKKVCTQQRRWQKEGVPIVPVSINLSRASLYFKDIVDRYKAITEEIGIDPKWVPIEITESAAINNLDIKTLADKFYEAGFPLHMDDFGSGYSSLASLNILHFDTLKLDKSLIDYIGNYGGDRLLFHTIALAKELGMHVTAEGVEELNQVNFLQKLNCDSIQGFYYSKPVTYVKYDEELRNTKNIAGVAAPRERDLAKRVYCNFKNFITDLVDEQKVIAKEKGKNILSDLFLLNNEVYVDTNNLTNAFFLLCGYVISSARDDESIICNIRQYPETEAGYAVYEVQFVVPHSDITYEKMRDDLTYDEALLSVRKIVDGMGGSIITKENGTEGFAIIVRLAFKVVSRSELNMTETESIIHRRLVELSSQKKVLIVEDNELNLALATEILQSVGFDVIQASNGKEAVEIIVNCENEDIKLILMDVIMPVMDGYEATKAIRALERKFAREIPIYALSTNAGEMDVNKAIESGMNGHIAKPLGVKELTKIITENL